MEHPCLLFRHWNGVERVHFDMFPPEDVRERWCEWLRFHGISPSDVPIPGWIERDPANCRIRYRRLLRDDDDMIVWNHGEPRPRTVEYTEQGEAPPKPFPGITSSGQWYPTRYTCTMGVDC
jgi:hypothetical protein